MNARKEFPEKYICVLPPQPWRHAWERWHPAGEFWIPAPVGPARCQRSQEVREMENKHKKTTPLGRGLSQFQKGTNGNYFRRRIIRPTPSSPSPVNAMMDGSGTVAMFKLQLTSVLCAPGDKSATNNSHCPSG